MYVHVHVGERYIMTILGLLTFAEQGMSFISNVTILLLLLLQYIVILIL